MEAKELSEKLDFTKGKAESYAWLGYLVNDLGQKDSAIILYRASLRAYTALDNDEGIANCIGNIGYVYSTTAKVDSTLKYYHEALRLREKLDDLYGLANSLNNLGYMYNGLGDSEQALRYHLRALSIRESIDDKEGQTMSLGNLAYIYKEMGDHANALSAYRRQHDINVEIGNKKALAESLQNIAFMAGVLGNWPEAVDGHRQSLAIRQELQYPRGISEAHYYLGEALCMIGDFAQGWHYMEKSLAGRISQGDERGIVNSLRTMSNQARAKGWHRRAVDLGEDAVERSKKLGFPKDTQRSLMTLSKAYSAAGDWEQAYWMAVEAQNLNDSIQKLADLRRMTRLQVADTHHRVQLSDSVAQAAVTAQKQYDQAIARLSATKQRNTAFAIGGVSLLMVFGAGTAFIVDRKRRTERHARKAAHLQTQAWRAQVNPRFIHSALNSINDYVQANERDLVSSFLTRFARLMRAVLENARHEEISLEKDLAVLRDYLELERSRMHGGFSYAIEVDLAINQDAAMVPPMLLQPFAEQAISNRMGRTDGPGHLVIRVQRSQGTLVLILEEDLQSEAADQRTASDRSEGTDITEARLALLAKQSNRQASVKVFPMPVGRRVELTLPLTEAA